ncbi:hypothetical protein [Neobacillus ginsengisoli]|uniref:Uncharacterized protein n=1 Tax=Neobacillus ginsengisoli TaxID=904295 RepID=A0ABT9XUH1_9BACI|nr:hypothetical protein [Neobacillus ginsengisoli]MDQ0199208.1 hypothetical protein [Neobacillus ginsengisoli]
MENDNKPNREVDRFSRFMFGNRKYRETYKSVENTLHEEPEQKEQSLFDSRSNRSDDWFFGIRRKESAANTHTTPNQIDNFLNNVDYDLLMETIDMFVTTSKQLKPLFKEFTPLLQRFSKKFTSNEDEA